MFQIIAQILVMPSPTHHLPHSVKSRARQLVLGCLRHQAQIYLQIIAQTTLNKNNSTQVTAGVVSIFKKKTEARDKSDVVQEQSSDQVGKKPKRRVFEFEVKNIANLLGRDKWWGESSSRSPSGSKGKEKVNNSAAEQPKTPDKRCPIDSDEEFESFSVEIMERFRNVFDMFDADGDGTISCDELGPILLSLGYSPANHEIKRILEEYDVDKSGDLDFEEYVNLLSAWVEEDELQLLEAFKVFDRNGDGYVTCSELRHALCTFGEQKFDEKELLELFQMLDENNDGFIIYEEFMRYMCEINRGPKAGALAALKL